MQTPTEERASALDAVDTTCPRCGTHREPDQEYCIECGLRLPAVDGTVPSLRRGWVRRLGWYPGDWIWVSLLTLLVAAAGATGAILLTRHTSNAAADTFTTSTPLAGPTESTVVQSTPSNVDTSTLPKPPEQPIPKPKPKPTGPPNGRIVWPAGKNGWTIVLNSYPFSGGRPTPLAAASRAARSHLTQVGVLDSAHYSSMHPGYYVVFSGIYGAKSAADAALRTARSSGFPSAYTRQVSR